MICSCGGIFTVIKVEEYPEELSKQERLIYDRVCDVQCLDCEKVIYSQPYDPGRSLNIVRSDI